MTAIRKAKFFYRDDCPKCPAAKEVIRQLQEAGYQVEEYDLDTTDGLGESTFYSVYSVPTLLLLDETEYEHERWVGEMPGLGVFQQLVAGSLPVISKLNMAPGCCDTGL